MKIFYDKHLPVEDEIDEKINQFIELIKADKLLKKYVRVFGLTGPAARGQASSMGSDIDFYCVTNYLNPLHEAYLHKKFAKIFNLNFDIGILAFSPSIFKRPDLMLYEFVNSGKIFYGKLNYALSISKIPLWEGIRVLTFKGNPFIANPNKHTYVKLILGLGEALLLLDKTYIADDFKRYSKVLKDKNANKINNFISEYKKAYDYRYSGKDIKLNKEKAISFLKQVWELYLKNYPDLKKIKALTLKERIGTRLFYTINYWRYFKKIRFTLREPFIKEILLIQKYLDYPNESLRKKIAMSWKASPRFWYPK